MRKIISRVLAVIAVIVILVAAMLGLNGCSKSETVNYNVTGIDSEHSSVYTNDICDSFEFPYPKEVSDGRIVVTVFGEDRGDIEKCGLGRFQPLSKYVDIGKKYDDEEDPDESEDE